MHPTLENVCEELQSLADAVRKASKENRTLTEAYGWNCPAMTRQDLASMPDKLSVWIKEAAVDELSDEDNEYLQLLPNKIAALKAQTVPQLFNGGNVPNASAAYITTMSFIERDLEAYYSWQRLEDPNVLPPKLSKKIRACAARLSEISPELDTLEGKVERILGAHDAAESLPTDMEALDIARQKIERIAEEAMVQAEKIASRAGQSQTRLNELANTASEANKILALCEEAYRAATSKGLASAFDMRALSLESVDNQVSQMTAAVRATKEAKRSASLS